MIIPFDAVGGVHSLTALLTDEVKYAAAHAGITFVVSPTRLPLYNANITNNASTVVCLRMEAAHKSKLKDYASYNAAKRGCAKFLQV